MMHRMIGRRRSSLRKMWRVSTSSRTPHDTRRSRRRPALGDGAVRRGTPVDMQSQTTKTDLNLWLAFVDEAKTHRLYAAFAIQAMNEGHLEAAEAFMEAAGAEIV